MYFDFLVRPRRVGESDLSKDLTFPSRSSPSQVPLLKTPDPTEGDLNDVTLPNRRPVRETYQPEEREKGTFKTWNYVFNRPQRVNHSGRPNGLYSFHRR
jgi:hypothetical protein